MTEPSTSESNINVHYINKLQRKLDEANIELAKVRKDNERLLKAARAVKAHWRTGVDLFGAISCLETAIDAAMSQETAPNDS